MKKIKEKRFLARNGAWFDNDKAKELGDYLTSHNLDLNNYKAIYEDAEKNNDSPFRNLLEWDDTQAASEYRLQQVREIVQHISIEIVYEDEKVVNLPRAFELVSRYNDQPKELVGILEGLSEEDSRKQIIQRAYSNLIGWWETYKSYQEFNKLGDPIEELKQELTAQGYVVQ